VEPSTRKSILFVDDEAPVLNLLQTLVRHANPEWDSSFVGSGTEALERMQDRSFDAVVSDMRMPEMNGAELLEKVRARSPRTARLVLSGYADQSMSIRSLDSAHQYLAKPFTLTGLQNTLNRIFAIAQYVPDPSLQSALGSIHMLASPVAIREQAMHQLASPAANTDAMGGLLAQDIAATAKLLQIVYSAFFGAPRALWTAKEACQAIGISLLRNLVTSDRLLIPSPADEVGGLVLSSLLRQSVNTGLRATRILSQEHAPPDAVKSAFTAGLLLATGRLALAMVRPTEYREVLRRAKAGETTIVQAERDAFGVSHAEAGAYLLGLWGIPDRILDLILHTFHPGPHRSRGFGPVTALHVASYLERSSGELPESAVPALDQEYLAALRISPERIKAWSRLDQAESDRWWRGA